MFFTRRDPVQELAVLWLREPDGTERALIDPNALSHGQKVTLEFWSVSADGKKLAYELSEGGDEETTIYIRDVDTAELLDDPIDRTRAGSFAWTPTDFRTTTWDAPTRWPSSSTGGSPR